MKEQKVFFGGKIQVLKVKKLMGKPVLAGSWLKSLKFGLTQGILLGRTKSNFWWGKFSGSKSKKLNGKACAGWWLAGCTLFQTTNYFFEIWLDTGNITMEES